MIVGLTGKNASGKGEVATFLTAIGFAYHSLSDVLREEMTARGMAISRDALIRFANDFRAAHGSAVLAERILARLDPEKNYVVDSIRNPAEVAALRRREDFRLLLVDADPSIRFARLKARARENDPATHEAFLRVEAAEAGGPDPHTQQLDAMQSLADAAVRNNGTLAELHEQVRAVLRTMAAQTGRPDWHTYFMNIAKVTALRSNCIKRKVAAVIVKDRRIVATGYNGTPRGIPNCNEGGCPRCNSFGKSGEDLGLCLCSHAEENAIVQAAYHGVSIKGATLYTTFSPCLICTKMIINAGLADVIYNQAYPMEATALDLLRTAGIHVTHHAV
ncbi:MAG: AAA family ATPase [Deltaproteobacteria bacterium]|nr:AAA family ATPase [Deltaproteobacteria bacterium]